MEQFSSSSSSSSPLSLLGFVLSLSLLGFVLFLVCEQHLEGIIRPLAGKIHNVLNLVHQETALRSAAARSSCYPPFVCSLLLSLV